MILLLLAAQITGTVRYENQDYNGGGPAGTQFIPIRRAQVELVNADTGNSWFGFSNDNGAYSITPVGPGSGPGLFNVFIRVYTTNTGGVTYNAEVRNNTSTNAVYTAISATVPRTLPADALPVNLDVPMGAAAEAFNIFDCAIWAFDYIAVIDALSGLPPLGPLPQVLCFWEPGAVAGTFFDPGTNRVFLRGIVADDDGFDDDIILHELGHFVSVNWSNDDSPGGFHSITDLVDPRLAWSEGWAHYFSGVVRAFANSVKPGQPGPPNPYFDPWTQVDVFSFGNSLFDIEAPSFPTQTITDRNEVAVAAGVWDAFDGVNEPPFDTIGAGLGGAKEINVWRILRVRLPTFTNVTLEDFRKGWELETPADLAALTGTAVAVGILRDRSVRFYADPDEPNNASPGVGLGAIPPTVTLVQRTFLSTVGPIGVGDEDWYNFTLPAPGFLRVQTLNLGDACDTMLELRDGADVLLATNDNRTGADPSSLIEMTVPAGAYRVRVLPAAGIAEFGFYDLRIEISTNNPPTATFAGTPTTGAAPLRVRFDATAADGDGIVSLHEVDFDGDGVFDYSSIEGANVTHTYAQPGAYTAVLRVTDNGGAIVLQSVGVTVTGPAGTVTVTESVGGATQPVAVTFGALLSGIAPAAYEWDFDGDGQIDATLTAGPAAAFTYRVAGAYTPRLYVTDTSGVRHAGTGDPVTVAPAGIPAVGLGAAPGAGAVPLTVTLTATAGLTTYEWDFDGDGRIDRETATNVVTHRYTRVGNFMARVVGIDALGRGEVGTAAVNVTQPSTTGGWIVYPTPGDTCDGDSVTVVAEMRPGGVVKLVQFQHKQDAMPFGPWFNIGGGFTEAGATARQGFDIRTVANLDVRDIRALIDIVNTTGDENLPNVQRDTAAALIREDAGGGLRLKDQRVRVLQDEFAPTLSRADLFFPARSSASGANITARWQELGDVFPHPTRNRIGGVWQVSVIAGLGTFDDTFWISLPYDDIDADQFVDGFALEDVNALEILEWNGVAWVRLFESDVIRSEQQVRVRTPRTGVFAIFGGPKAGGGGGGPGAEAFEDGSLVGRSKFVGCAASAVRPVAPWAALLLIGLALVAARRYFR